MSHCWMFTFFRIDSYFLLYQKHTEPWPQNQSACWTVNFVYLHSYQNTITLIFYIRWAFLVTLHICTCSVLSREEYTSSSWLTTMVLMEHVYYLCLWSSVLLLAGPLVSGINAMFQLFCTLLDVIGLYSYPSKSYSSKVRIRFIAKGKPKTWADTWEPGAGTDTWESKLRTWGQGFDWYLGTARQAKTLWRWRQNPSGGQLSNRTGGLRQEGWTGSHWSTVRGCSSTGTNNHFNTGTGDHCSPGPVDRSRTGTVDSRQGTRKFRLCVSGDSWQGIRSRCGADHWQRTRQDWW